jgi:beta-phosphoglucomutase
MRDNDRMSAVPATRISTVIFDFDGVIADTEGLHLRAFQEIFERRGWQLDERVYFDRYLGYDDVGLVVAFGREHSLGLDEATVDLLVDEKTRLFATYLEAGEVLFPTAPACIGRLAAAYSLGIASGALKIEITSILTAAGLLHRFPVIVAADDVTECKPAPEPYLKAAEGLHVDPARCVAIEDSPAGLAAAKAAGMRTIGLTTTSPRQLLTDADLILDGLHQVSAETVAKLGR